MLQSRGIKKGVALGISNKKKQTKSPIGPGDGEGLQQNGKRDMYGETPGKNIEEEEKNKLPVYRKKSEQN